VGVTSILYNTHSGLPILGSSGLIRVRLWSSLVPRPSTPSAFDRLQYAKTEGEGLGNFITWSAAQPSSRHASSQ